jgi:hypothetical protein
MDKQQELRLPAEPEREFESFKRAMNVTLVEVDSTVGAYRLEPFSVQKSLDPSASKDLSKLDLPHHTPERMLPQRIAFVQSGCLGINPRASCLLFLGVARRFHEFRNFFVALSLLPLE